MKSELEGGESDNPTRLAGGPIVKSVELRTGKILIEEYLDTLACIQCNAGAVCAIFAGMMIMIRHKEAETTPMSIVPSPFWLNLMMAESCVSFAAGFMIMGSMGLYHKLWSNPFFRIDVLRAPSLLIGTGCTFFSVAATIARLIVKNGSDAVDIVPDLTKYVMFLLFFSFDVLIIVLAVWVMVRRKWGKSFTERLDQDPSF